MAKDHEITLFNRGKHNPNSSSDVETLVGDRDGDLAPLKGRSWDAVIDTSGFVPRVVSRSAQLLADQVGHYTFISSISVYSDFSQLGICEDDSVQRLSQSLVDEITRGTAGPIYGPYYGGLKVLCETAVESAMPGRVLSVRSGQIVGPHDYTDRLPYWITRVARGGTVLAPGRPGRQVQVIDVRDLSEWIIRMIEDNHSGVYNATAPETLTMERLLNECRAATDSGAEFVWVTEQFLRDNRVSPWVEMPLWIPETYSIDPDSDKPARGFLAVNSDKAVRAGLTFRPIRDTIQYSLPWCLNRSNTDDRHAGLSPDRERELLQLWSTERG